MNAQDRNTALKKQEVLGKVLKGPFAICEVAKNLRNFKNNMDISGKELRLQLSNVIRICTESYTFLETRNMKQDNM